MLAAAAGCPPGRRSRHPMVADDRSSPSAVRIRRRRYRGSHGRRRRLADDSVAGAALRHSSGDRRRHGSPACRDHQGRGYLCAREAGPRRLAHHRTARGRKPPAASGDALRTLHARDRRSRRIEDHHHHARSRAAAHGGRARAALVSAPLSETPTEPRRRAIRRSPCSPASCWASWSPSPRWAPGRSGVTALFFLYPRSSAARIVASDLAHAVPLTLVAGCGHWLFGAVDWQLLRSLLVGSLPGIYIGSQFVGRIPDAAASHSAGGDVAVGGTKLIASLEDLYLCPYEIAATALPRGGARERPQHHGRRAPAAYLATRA